MISGEGKGPPPNIDPKSPENPPERGPKNESRYGPIVLISTLSALPPKRNVFTKFRGTSTRASTRTSKCSCPKVIPHRPKIWLPTIVTAGPPQFCEICQLGFWLNPVLSWFENPHQRFKGLNLEGLRPLIVPGPPRGRLYFVSARHHQVEMETVFTHPSSRH